MKAAQKLTKIIHTAAADGSRDAVALRARPIRAKCVHAGITSVFFGCCCVLPFGVGADQEQSSPSNATERRKKSTRQRKTCDVMEFYDRYIGKSFHSAAVSQTFVIGAFFLCDSPPPFRACLCTSVLLTPFYILCVRVPLERMALVTAVLGFRCCCCFRSVCSILLFTINFALNIKV